MKHKDSLFQGETCPQIQNQYVSTRKYIWRNHMHDKMFDLTPAHSSLASPTWKQQSHAKNQFSTLLWIGQHEKRGWCRQ